MNLAAISKFRLPLKLVQASRLTAVTVDRCFPSSDHWQRLQKRYISIGKRTHEKSKTDEYAAQETKNTSNKIFSGVNCYQWKIYSNGALNGEKPKLPVEIDLLEQQFVEKADPNCLVWLYGKAGGGTTYRDNRDDFDSWAIVPRMLTGQSQCDISARFKMRGKEFSFRGAVGIAPVGVQCRVTYPSMEGDLHAARAAAKQNLLFVLSHVSSQPLEAVAQAMKEVDPNSPAPWYQLYKPTDISLCKSILRRAKAAGYGAIVCTVDTPKYGFRTDELDAAYLPQADARIQWGQALYDPCFNQMLKEQHGCVAHEQFSSDSTVPVNKQKALMQMIKVHGGSLGETWRPDVCNKKDNSNMEWLVKFCHGELQLPVVTKGLLHPDDVKKALDVGVDAIWVSNHGGRQVDGSISSIEALPDIEKVVFSHSNGPVPIFLDSGIRRGQHVFKAMALGADMVMVGRAPIFGLGLAGQAGVEHVMATLMSETENISLNCGVGCLREIPRNLLVKKIR